MKRHLCSGETIFAKLLLAALPAMLLASCSSGGQVGGAPPPATGISLTRIAGVFTSPVAISNAGDGNGRLFVVEQGGAVKIIRNGTVAARPFLNISSLVTAGGEQGLLGIAFPPGFATRQNFYVNYIRKCTYYLSMGNTRRNTFNIYFD